MDVDEQIDLRVAQLVAKRGPPNELGGPAPKPKLLRGLVDERSSRRACRRRRQHGDDLRRLRKRDKPTDDLDARRLLGDDD
jgi:hypothetical protein